MSLIKNKHNNLRPQELEIVYSISRIVAGAQNLESALEEIIVLARKVLIFDNIVLYEPISENQLEPVHPRAIGRGRSLGADLVWGETVAKNAYDNNQLIIQVEDISSQIQDRTNIRYYLGIPLNKGEKITGVLTFIRFGGPPYLDDQIRLAEYIAENVAQLLEHRNLVHKIADFEANRRLEYLQEEFIGMISHELLSPLGSIKGYTTTLLRNDVEWDENKRSEFLGIINSETDRLQNLIEVLLDSSRLQSGSLVLNLKLVNTISLLKEITERAKERSSQLEFELKPANRIPDILADPVQLTRVFDNVISNAAKYAPGSPVNIAIRKLEDNIQIAFSDLGPGVAPDQLERIFDRFYRIPDPQFSAVQGTGLGLYICRQIVEAHNGSINAESLPGAGTTIKICLPIKQNSFSSKGN
jgi:K+-sensing histidine kinase KdpD